MEYKDFLEKALTAAEQKYPCSDMQTVLENIAVRAKNTESDTASGRVSALSARENNQTRTRRVLSAIGYTVGAAALIFACVFGLRFVIENGVLIEGGPVSANTSTAITEKITTDNTTPEPVGHVVTPRMEAAWKLTNDYMHGLLFSITDDEVKAAMKTSCGAEPVSVTSLEVPEGTEEIRLYIYDNLPFFAYDAEMGAVISDSRGLIQVDYTIETNSGTDTKAVYENIKDKLSEMLGQPDSYDSSFSSWDVMETGICFDLQKLDDHHVKFFMYNKNIGKEKDNDIKTTTPNETENIGTDSTAVTGETTAPADPVDEQPADDELKALVEQGAEACGFKATVSDLTKASLKLNYYCDGENSKYLAFMWGGQYEIQTLSGNAWVTYDPDNLKRWNDEQMWFDSSFSINEFPDHSEEHETILFYGDNMYESEIPTGNYRVVKQITVFGNGKNLGTLAVKTEFTIDERTPNIFGITMTAKNATPEGVTLSVQQSGAHLHVKRNLGYEYPYYIQRKTKTGEWEKLESNPNTWAPDIEPINENGTTEINIRFSTLYGNLPSGTYRLSQTFVNYVYSVSGELSVINRSTYFCEFEITGGKKDWGITLSANDDITAEGLTLVISQHGGSYTGELEYGEPYSIERMNGNKWEPLDYLDGAAWNDLAYYVEPDTDTEIKLDWKWLYGTLPAGKYRIAKEFMDFRGSGDFDNETFYAEFEITGDIESKLGISLRALQYNARKMTLQIVQNGGTVEGEIGTNPDRYTIERKADGKWQSYYSTQAGVPTPDLGMKIKRSGVTEVKHDWSKTAGSLPVGHYRLGMTFSCGNMTETHYCEFTVDKGATNELGISIEVMELSKTGARLSIESKGADEQGFAYYDGVFGLQKQANNSSWTELEFSGEPKWPQYAISRITMAASGYSGQMIDIDWTDIFGKLEKGHYRVSKKFHTGEGTGYKEITLYAEFDINADTPETLSD